MKRFIVNTIKVIVINANPIVTKLTLNSAIITINIFFIGFARKVSLRGHVQSPLPHYRIDLGR